MREATDTILRMLVLLQMIPRFPKKMSTTKIREKLNQDPDFRVSARSIQRDLERLSQVFPLSSEKEGRANHWFWSSEHEFTQIPAMDESTALALKLASEHLKPAIPPATLVLLEPYFKRATEKLRESKFQKWPEKMHIINRGLELIPPPIDPDVQETVYAALLENKQFEADYKGREPANSTRRTLNPIGIVFRHGVIYLVATSWDYDDPRHYALHRMHRATILDAPAKRLPEFDFSEYVKKSFPYPMSDKKIKLRALFSKDAALHLTESKLSDDQKVTENEGGGMLVEATVADTAELRWWLLGFGSGVEIIGPRELRNEFSQLAGEMRDIYQSSMR